MGKIKLKYTGLHLPQEVVEVEEYKAKGLVARGDYSLSDGIVLNQSVKDNQRPTSKWSEKKIKTWILSRDINIGYNVSNETKADKLKELKDAGHI